MLLQTIKAQRPSLLDQGIILAIEDMIKEVVKIAGDDVVILWHNCLEEEIKLPDEQATSIYRIVQESLSNILRHSQADQAIVTARKDKSLLELIIEDDGIGISSDGQEEHYGFLNMKERATMIGADLTIDSEPGRGTSVKVSLKI